MSYISLYTWCRASLIERYNEQSRDDRADFRVWVLRSPEGVATECEDYMRLAGSRLDDNTMDAILNSTYWKDIDWKELLNDVRARLKLLPLPQYIDGKN